MRKQSFPHLMNVCHLVVLCAVVAAIMAPRAAASPTTALVESLTATTEPDRFRYRGAAHTVEQDGIIQYAELDRSPGLKWDWPYVECLPGVPYAAYVEFYAPRKFLQHAEKLTFVLEGKPGEPVRASLDLDGVPPDTWQIAYMGTVMGDHGGSGFAVSAEPDSNLKWYAGQKLRIRRFWAVPAMGEIDPEQFLVAYRTWLVEQIRDQEYLANYRAPHYPIAEDMFHIGGYFGGSGWTPNLFGLAAYWYDDTAEATKAYRELFYRDMKHRGLDGRDHHVKGFSCWLAGGGIRGGMTYGATDDLGYHCVQDVVHIRDLHATMLHQLGVDHERLSVQFQGLDMRLTGVEPARVISEVLV